MPLPFPNWTPTSVKCISCVNFETNTYIHFIFMSASDLNRYIFWLHLNADILFESDPTSILCGWSRPFIYLDANIKIFDSCDVCIQFKLDDGILKFWNLGDGVRFNLHTDIQRFEHLGSALPSELYGSIQMFGRPRMSGVFRRPNVIRGPLSKF